MADFVAAEHLCRRDGVAGVVAKIPGQNRRMRAINENVLFLELEVTPAGWHPCLETSLVRRIHKPLQSAIARNAVRVYQVDARISQLSHPDTQIVAVVAEKFFAEIPRVEVEITEVLNESLLDCIP